MIVETEIFENNDEKLNMTFDNDTLDILEFRGLNSSRTEDYNHKLEGRVTLLEQKIKILEEKIERKTKICSMHHSQLKKSLDLRQTEGEVQENDSQIIWSTINNLVSNTKEQIDKLRVEFYTSFNNYKDEIKKLLQSSSRSTEDQISINDEGMNESNFETKIRTLILDAKDDFSHLLVEVYYYYGQ